MAFSKSGQASIPAANLRELALIYEQFAIIAVIRGFTFDFEETVHGLQVQSATETEVKALKKGIFVGTALAAMMSAPGSNLPAAMIVVATISCSN